MITGYIEREAIAVAELHDGVLVPAGLVKFGLAGKGLWWRLDPLRTGPSARSGLVPVRPELVAGAGISDATVPGRSATVYYCRSAGREAAIAQYYFSQ